MAKSSSAPKSPAAPGDRAADLATARRVMAQARAGIAALEEGLGAPFIACLDIIAAPTAGPSATLTTASAPDADIAPEGPASFVGPSGAS